MVKFLICVEECLFLEHKILNERKVQEWQKNGFIYLKKAVLICVIFLAVRVLTWLR